MRETGRDGFMSKVQKRLKEEFPDCTVLRNDPSSNVQGVPDLTVLNGDRWASLEVKRSATASPEPGLLCGQDEPRLLCRIHLSRERRKDI